MVGFSSAAVYRQRKSMRQRDRNNLLVVEFNEVRFNGAQNVSCRSLNNSQRHELCSVDALNESNRAAVDLQVRR